MEKIIEGILKKKKARYEKVLNSVTGSCFVILKDKAKRHEYMYFIEKNTKFICTYYVSEDCIIVMDKNNYLKSSTVPAAYVEYKEKKIKEEERRERHRQIQKERKNA